MNTTTKTAAKATTDTKTAAAEELKNLETIGTGERAAARLKIAAAARKTANPIFRLVLDNYCKANRAYCTDKAMSAAKIHADTANEYTFTAATLYTAAARYAEASRGGTKEAVTATANALFKQWKAYLALLAEKPVNACGADENALFRSVTVTKKEGMKYAARERDDGTIAYDMTKGAAFDAIASKAAFFKAVERLAVERILGMDGVVSIETAKAARKASAAAREREETRYTKGMELDTTSKGKDTTTSKGKDTTSKDKDTSTAA